MSQNDPETHEQMLAEIRRSQDLVRERVAKSSWSYDLVYSAVAAAFVGGMLCIRVPHLPRRPTMQWFDHYYP